MLVEIDYWSNFPYAGNPVFARGDYYLANTNAGLFAFTNPSGATYDYRSFRPVLATLWYNKFSYLLKRFFKENCIGCIKEV